MAAMLSELARRVRAFSARSALKKNSNGDSSFRGGAGGLAEPLSSESVVGGDGSWLGPVEGRFWLGDVWGADVVRAKKLGMGKADGAGEWWKVAPAKAGPCAGGNEGLCRSLELTWLLAPLGEDAPFLLRALWEVRLRCF